MLEELFIYSFLDYFILHLIQDKHDHITSQGPISQYPFILTVTSVLWWFYKHPFIFFTHFPSKHILSNTTGAVHVNRAEISSNLVISDYITSAVLDFIELTSKLKTSTLVMHILTSQWATCKNCIYTHTQMIMILIVSNNMNYNN